MTETDTSPKTEGGTEQAKRSLWGNWWVQRFGMSFLILCAVMGWFVYQRGLWFFNPRLGSFESIREDDTPAKRLADKLGLPELPDLTQIDEAGARHFYTALYNVRRFSRTAEHYGVLGRVYEAQGLREKAMDVYRRAIALNDDDLEWHYHLALAAQHLGQLEVAHKGFKRTIELDPGYAPAYKRLGDVLRKTGELDEAKKMFNAYVERRPDDILGYLGLAQVARDRDDWQGVVDHVTAARELGETGKTGHQLLGVAYHHLGDKDKSETHLRAARAEDQIPRMDDPLENQMLGLQTSESSMNVKYEMCMDQGRYREALGFAKQLLDRTRGTPEEAVAWARVAECHRQLREYDEALAAVAKAIEQELTAPEPYVIHGRIRLAIQDPVRSLRLANKAVALRDGYVPAHFLRAQVLLFLAVQPSDKLRLVGMTGSPVVLVRRAVTDLQRVLQLEPTNYEGLFHLAYGLGMLGDYAEAAKFFERAAEIRPDAKDIAQLLAAARAQDASGFWPTTQPVSSPATPPATGAAPRPTTRPMTEATTAP